MPRRGSRVEEAQNIGQSTGKNRKISSKAVRNPKGGN